MRARKGPAAHRRTIKRENDEAWWYAFMTNEGEVYAQSGKPREWPYPHKNWPKRRRWWMEAYDKATAAINPK